MIKQSHHANVKDSQEPLFDTHCHIDFDDFDHDRQKVIQSAAQNGVTDIIVPAVSQQRWHKTIAVCQKNPSCHLALGLHPIFIDDHQPQHLIELSELLRINHVVAIGEIGLDFHRKDLDTNKQIIFFTKQLIIAKQHQLPVIIHNRKAHDECIKLLTEHQVKGGIIHAFNGSIQHAEKYIELGFALGFGGMLTFERSRKLHNLLKAISLEHVVLETDAPDMTVAQHKGSRNSPEYIPHILKSVADIKSIDVNEVAMATSKNAHRVLNLTKKPIR